MPRSKKPMYGKLELTIRERAIAYLIWKGHTNKQIAERVGCTEGSIKNSTRDIYDKSGMANRLEFALWYDDHIKELIPEGASE
jgi:DNA-binding NarL/FixJ family response regulator